MAVPYASRPEWGADMSIPRLGSVRPRALVDAIVIHHTVTIDPDPSPNVWETDSEIFSHMRKLQRLRADLGLDVPYHFVGFLRPDGSVTWCEGRGEDRKGAHNGYGFGREWNTTSLGICLAGNFEAAEGDVIVGITRLCAWLRHEANFPHLGDVNPSNFGGRFGLYDGEVFGHRDVREDGTACPGAHVYASLPEVRFLAATQEDSMTPDQERLLSDIHWALLDTGHGLRNHEAAHFNAVMAAVATSDPSVLERLAAIEARLDAISSLKIEGTFKSVEGD